jgi:hypothetical protein
MKFERKFLLKIFLFTAFSLALFSCAAELPDINQAFEEQYGGQVEAMRQQRAAQKGENNEVVFSTPPTQADLVADAAKNGDYQPYKDVAKFGDVQSQIYLPSVEVYEQQGAKASNSLPSDMFYITYKTDLYPPFRPVGSEFDSIPIPPQDAYGVRTEMSQKPYLLVGNDSLQRSIDKINGERTRSDTKISEILIKEQRQQKQKEKMAKIFGQEEIL